ENKGTFVLTRTSLDGMPRTFVHTRDKLVGELPSVADEPTFTPRATIEKLAGDEGFYATIVRPHDFDPKKRYPGLVDVYGGPHHLHVQKAMRNWLVPVARGSGVCSRRNRESRHTGSRARLGAVHLRQVRLRPDRGPGEGTQAPRREIP